jgi:hypothetical protein
MCYFGWRTIHTVRLLPEAYAAWDTGTLLIQYMESHGGMVAGLMG